MAKWGRRLVLVVLSAMAVLVAGKVILEIRDRADPVDVGKVAKAFGKGGGAATTTGASGPTALANGVWIYNAVGTEYIDLLGGPMHEFPPHVAQTVAATDCGQTVTVHLFEQREDVIELCRNTDGALLVHRFITRHEFAGVKDETVTSGYTPLPLWWPGMADDVGRPAVTATGTSTGNTMGETTVANSVKVVAVQDVDVGGTRVKAVHVQLNTNVGADGGTTRGEYLMDFWFSLDSAVIVHRTLDATVSAHTPFGTLGFEEGFDITAQSVQPASG